MVVVVYLLPNQYGVRSTYFLLTPAVSHQKGQTVRSTYPWKLPPCLTTSFYFSSVFFYSILFIFPYLLLFRQPPACGPCHCPWNLSWPFFIWPSLSDAHLLAHAGVIPFIHIPGPTGKYIPMHALRFATLACMRAWEALNQLNLVLLP